MESNTVFRIAIAHATDFKTTIDTVNIMVAVGKYYLQTVWEYKRSISPQKCLKIYKMVYVGFTTRNLQQKKTTYNLSEYI